MREFFVATIVFTVIGLATEACFTGVRDPLRSLFRGKPVDWTLPCRTWLWSILVFGLSAAIAFPFIDVFCPLGLRLVLAGARRGILHRRLCLGILLGLGD